MARKIDIIHQDEDLVLVNKAPGLLSIPDRYKPDMFNLKKSLDQKFGKIYVVHRLDRETSGIICFARNAEAHRSLNEQFEKHTIDKRYLVLVSGQVSKDHDIIELPIAQLKPDASIMHVSKTGKPAKTTFTVLERYRDYTLIEARIHTGRTHQIRVHFQAYGHPLAVDEMYGGQSEIFLSSFKTRGYNLRKGKEERALMDRTTLHARSLKFSHPGTGKEVVFKASLPKDLKATLNQLGKWNTL